MAKVHLICKSLALYIYLDEASYIEKRDVNTLKQQVYRRLVDTRRRHSFVGELSELGHIPWVLLFRS